MVRMINFLTLAKLIRDAFNWFLPWIARFFVAMLSFMLTLLISFWGGVPARVDQMANEWLDRAYLGGFPTQWDRRLYWTFYCLAFVMLIVGWVILSFITVWIVQLIFR